MDMQVLFKLMNILGQFCRSERWALKGIAYQPLGAAVLLRRNLLIYGLGGVLLPFAGIKAIDVVVVAAGLA